MFNTEFKKIFSIILKEIIGTYLMNEGFEYNMRFAEGLFFYRKLTECVDCYICFQIKSFNYNIFDFYFSTSGVSANKVPQILRIDTEVNSEDQLRAILIDIKSDIQEQLLPWFTTAKKIELNYKEILLACISDRFQNMGFEFINELYDRKIVYPFSREINHVHLLLTFPFIRKTDVGYDVIRFEVSELSHAIRARLIFYPETTKTKCTSIHSLAKSIGNVKFENEAEYKEILTKMVIELEKYADRWFSENRPSKKPEIENLGLFPTLEELPQKLRKEFEVLLKSLPPIK